MDLNSNYLLGERILLRELRVSDVGENYYSWMNDSAVNQFLESRFFPQSLESIIEFTASSNRDPDVVLFAIVEIKSKIHIGNIKLGPINWIHRNAEMGLLIGEKIFWGQGFASEAISLVCEYARNLLNLHKVTAGCYSSNIGSAKAFEKAGFQVEGIRKEQVFVKGSFEDTMLLGKRLSLPA